MSDSYMLERISILEKWFVRQVKIINQLNKCTNKYGLSFLQFDILNHISNSNELSSTELSVMLEMPKTSVSRVLKALQEKNLIVKVYGSFNDSRKIDIKITEDGEKVLSELGPLIDDQMKSIGL